VKILLINQFFWPDEVATSLLLTDLARHLADQGHKVTVICGRSTYTDTGSSVAADLRVLRTPNLGFAHGKVARLLSYASFFAFAIVYGLCVPRPDLVVTLTTPPLLALVGTLVKKLRRARHFSWEMDLYPEVALDLKLFHESSWTTRIVAKLADYTRQKGDGIMVLGKCMRQRLIASGISSEKIFVAENWADGHLIQPMPLPAGDRLTVLYSGNLGWAHDIETISAAMDKLKTNTQFQFVFAGGGPRREALEQFCESRQIRNVSFIPHCRMDELSEALGSGHIGLVTQNQDCLGSVVPSKIYGLMAAGRPALFIGPKEATPSQIIRRFDCGWQVDCKDSERVIVLLKALAADMELVQQAGSRARQAFLAHYDLPIGVSRLCSILGVAAIVKPEEMAVSIAD
jgi:colanic acid biosynthesis glycosyl transferase WcaI